MLRRPFHLETRTAAPPSSPPSQTRTTALPPLLRPVIRVVDKRTHPAPPGFPATRWLEDFVLAESRGRRQEPFCCSAWGRLRWWRDDGCATSRPQALVETLYSGLADNSVGRVIERLLRHDLVAHRRPRLCATRRCRQPAALQLRGRRLRAPQPGPGQPLALRVLGSLPARAHHRGGDARPPAPPCDDRRHQ